ncbi:MAG: hypothetical protein M1840_007668 [Geoglossum simile]|nr:MAG: hypothetical protein M1840_007668 [Geoglossum simile]
MARLREEREESDDEFPDISVVISRFYQNKLSKPASEERGRTEEPEGTSKTSSEDSQPLTNRRYIAPTVDLASPALASRTPAEAPDVEYPSLESALAEADTSENSLSGDGPFVLKFSPPKSKIVKDSPTKQSRIPSSPRPSKTPARGPEIPEDWSGERGRRTPRSGRQWKSRSVVQSSPERSIAEHTPGKAKQDRAALNAKKMFNEKKHDLARDFLKDLDDKVSGGQIASITASTGGVKLIWSKKLTSTAGRANWKREKIIAPAAGQLPRGSGSQSASYRHITSIELSEKVIDDENRLLNALSHEYCHLANFMISGVLDHPHGESFKEWAKTCTRAFSHRGVCVTTKHSYAVDYKYIWQCTNCGVLFKRHSKSLDPTRHACGSCKAKIVQIQPTPRKGELSEYQVFVRDNFAQVRRENPGCELKAIMALLGVAYRREKGAGGVVAAGEGVDSLVDDLEGLVLGDP